MDVGTPTIRPRSSTAAPPEFPFVISASVLITVPNAAVSYPDTTPLVHVIDTRLPWPQVVLCAEPLVAALLESGAHHYLDFRSITARWRFRPLCSGRCMPPAPEPALSQRLSPGAGHACR